MFARTLALVAVIALAATRLAHAQSADAIQAVDARWVVVIADETPLRCGDFERFYPVATLDAGTHLRLDGQSEEWARVVYPTGLAALVSARDATPAGDGDLRLLRPSRLRAANTNPNVGVAGSWRSVFRTALPEGTPLDLVGAITSEDGDVEGYRVLPQHPPVAPHPPHAYVQLDEVREATLEERARFNRELEQSASADRPTPAGPDSRPDPTPDAETEARPDPEVPANPAPAPMPTPPMTGQPTPDATEPADPQPADARPAVTGGEPQREQTQPAAQPDAQPATQPAAPPDPQPEATPADQPDDAEEPSAEAEAESPEGEPTQEEPTPEPEPLDIEELEAEFLRIRRLGRQPLDDALDEIVGEYRRTLATLEAPAFIRIAESRLEWLELRRATRDERRDLEAALQAANGRTQAIRERLEAIERTRRYAVVGRLVPSPLYDGDPLPLMYRVESVGGREASRTLGYVRPRAGDDLAAKLGELVGVVGDVRIDRSLGLLLIRPVRVDVLTTE